ncbi:MAG: hypothetical protein QM790_13100 [Nibricoccus sp.]
MPSEKPLVYLVLGAAGSGRREILVDLLADGLAEGDQSLVLVSDEEKGSEADSKLGRVRRWVWMDGQIGTPDNVLRGVTHAFFVADGRRNPVDQIEAFKAWLVSNNAELARVICIVNCQLAEKHRDLVAWYEACIHFSDVVLLNRREGVANKWMSDFQNRFKDQFFPCLFEFVKESRVKNPALILDPDARRVSQFFETSDLPFVDAETEIEMGTGDDDEPEEIDDDDGEIVPEDPYMARRAGGRRVKELPDVAKFVD